MNENTNSIKPSDLVFIALTGYIAVKTVSILTKTHQNRKAMKSLRKSAKKFEKAAESARSYFEGELYDSKFDKIVSKYDI